MKKRLAFITAGIALVLLAVVLIVNIRTAKADDGGSEPNGPACEEWNGYTADDFSFNKFGIPYSGDEITINETSCSWSFISHESWISISPASGSGGGTVIVSAGSNFTGSTRFGWVHIFDDGVKISTRAVVQSGTKYWMLAEL